MPFEHSCAHDPSFNYLQGLVVKILSIFLHLGSGVDKEYVVAAVDDELRKNIYKQYNHPLI